jgi:hypothetical protein
MQPMKTILVIVVLASVLTGCATASRVALPEGDKGFAIRCGDPKLCYNKAAEVCAPDVYELVATNSNGIGTTFKGTGGFGTITTLIVHCKVRP